LTIRVNPPTDLRIIITAGYIIESRLLVVDIATVAEGVELCNGIVFGIICIICGNMDHSIQEITPSIIGVGNNTLALVVKDRHHIALQVRQVIIGRTLVGDTHGNTLGGIAEDKMVVSFRGRLGTGILYHHVHQLTAVVHIVIGQGAVCPLCTQSVGIVGIRPGGGAVGHGYQFPAMLPGEGPAVQGVGVADAIVGNSRTVVGGEQVTPGFVSVGIGDRICGCTQGTGGVSVLGTGLDITGVVVSPGVGKAASLVILPDKLILLVVDIAGGIHAVADGKNIAVAVVGVAIGSRSRGGDGGIGGDLGGGITVYRGVSKAFGENSGLPLLRHLLRYPAQSVVGVLQGDAVGGDGGDPVIVVVGVAADALYPVDSLGQAREIVVDIIAVAYPEDKETIEPSPRPLPRFTETIIPRKLYDNMIHLI